MAVRTNIYAKRGRGGTNAINLILTDYKRFMEITKKAARPIFKEAGEIILEETLPLVPVQYGSLRESGRVKVEDHGRGLTVNVSFGGDLARVRPSPNAPTGIVDYAVIVHEDLNTPRQNGQAKFLEVGAMRARDRVEKHIITRLKEIKV